MNLKVILDVNCDNEMIVTFLTEKFMLQRSPVALLRSPSKDTNDNNEF